ncbi:MAG TPA: hypothetical protein VFO41_18130 [Alphaproteobacteria bacterium]|nr:hypothetical protein [Alphaproteobacteria bacterium]
MADWRTIAIASPIGSADGILPWVPEPRRSVTAGELAIVTALSVAFVVSALIVTDRKRLAALRRLLLTRHLFLRAPFYRRFGTGWTGRPHPAVG